MFHYCILRSLHLVHTDCKTILKSNLNLIFDNTTVLYFWDNASRYHFENSHIKVNTLNDLFPEIDFIAININSMHTNAWKNMLYAKQYSTNNEYRFANPSFAKKRLAINYIKKVLIVDKKGFILNSTADLYVGWLPTRVISVP